MQQAIKPQVGSSDVTKPSRNVEEVGTKVELPIDKSAVKIMNHPVFDIRYRTNLMEQLADLYMKGFSGSGWGEHNTLEDAISKLYEQFKNDKVAATLAVYGDKIRGFFTSQILSRENAYKRLGTSIAGYSQEVTDQYEINEDIELVRMKFEEMLMKEGVSPDAFPSSLAIMEDLVMDPKYSSFPNLVKIVHANVEGILDLLPDQEEDSYALTWTNKDNPIYKFLKNLGYPQIHLMEVPKTVIDSEGNKKIVDLQVFAVNLNDLLRISDSEGTASRELMKRTLKNNPIDIVSHLGRKLQKRLRNSIFSNTIKNFQGLLEQ